MSWWDEIIKAAEKAPSVINGVSSIWEDDADLEFQGQGQAYSTAPQANAANVAQAKTWSQWWSELPQAVKFSGYVAGGVAVYGVAKKLKLF